MLVNDDTAAFNRVFRTEAHAMRRRINRDAYNVLIVNAPLSDGTPLFHSNHNNLDSTGLAAGAPIDAGYQKMGAQGGLTDPTPFGIVPRYLIVPLSLSGTALSITHDMAQPAAAGDANLTGPFGPRPLITIFDGILDGLGSATNWWLAADPSMFDTVEVTFLRGESTPFLEQVGGFTRDVINYKIRQTYGVKAIDFRGLYQGNS